MHQNLLDRPDLDRKQRLEAVFELGQDFLKAGFLVLWNMILYPKKNLLTVFIVIQLQ